MSEYHLPFHDGRSLDLDDYEDLEATRNSWEESDECGDSDETAEEENPWDDFYMIFPASVAEGAQTLREVINCLRKRADELEEMEKESWRLTEPISEGSGLLVYEPGEIEGDV